MKIIEIVLLFMELYISFIITRRHGIVIVLYLEFPGTVSSFIDGIDITALQPDRTGTAGVTDSHNDLCCAVPYNIPMTH